MAATDPSEERNRLVIAKAKAITDPLPSAWIFAPMGHIYIEGRDSGTLYGEVYYEHPGYEIGPALQVHDWVFVLERMRSKARAILKARGIPAPAPEMWALSAFRENAHYSFYAVSGLTDERQLEMGLLRQVLVDFWGILHPEDVLKKETPFSHLPFTPEEHTARQTEEKLIRFGVTGIPPGAFSSPTPVPARTLVEVEQIDPSKLAERDRQVVALAGESLKECNTWAFIPKGYLYVDDRDTSSFFGEVMYDNPGYEMGLAVKVRDWVFVLERPTPILRDVLLYRKEPVPPLDAWVFAGFRGTFHCSFWELRGLPDQQTMMRVFVHEVVTTFWDILHPEVFEGNAPWKRGETFDAQLVTFAEQEKQNKVNEELVKKMAELQPPTDLFDESLNKTV